uniref:WD_REPEATS_REGION domain-containing protein n=1 Tax=Panagrellus redivivus TaxID=6233 RepID=A0A7E4UZR6_PANRE
MYEFNDGVDLTPPVGAFSNNVSGYYYEPRFTTYVAAGGKHSVGLCQWDSKFDNVKTDQIIMHDETEDVNPVIIQVKLVSPNDRGPPIVVITTLTHVRLYAVADTKHIFSVRQPGFKTKIELTKEYEDRDASGKTTAQDVIANAKEMYQISRGITCVDSYIYVGCNDGSILVMHCNNSRHVTLKPTLKEHQNAIIGLATCAYDYLTVCADVTGDVSVWPRNFKTVTKLIRTKHNISALNILRKHIIVGNYQGLVLLFNIASGELVAEIAAHGREVTSVSVAPESAYMLTASRDGVVNIWKLHTRRPEAFSVRMTTRD